MMSRLSIKMEWIIQIICVPLFSLMDSYYNIWIKSEKGL